jgi:hypothetical protein
MDTTSQAVPLALEQHTGLGGERGDLKRTVKEIIMNVLAENLESMIDDVVQRKRGLSDRLLSDEDDPLSILCTRMIPTLTSDIS